MQLIAACYVYLIIKMGNNNTFIMIMRSREVKREPNGTRELRVENAVAIVEVDWKLLKRKSLCIGGTS